MVSRVRAIAESNIGVMAHIGLTPQSATKLGGFRAQGRTAEAALRLYDDALALQDAGCFALVLEAVPAPVAARITAALDVPTIGIGAGAGCDGQVLVWHDLLGMYGGPTPRFVKRYAELADEIRSALESYVADVRDGSFPEEQHTYSIPDEELARFEAALEAREPARELLRLEDYSAASAQRASGGGGREGGPRPGPAVHGADADHEQRRRPEHEGDPEPGEDLPPGAGVGAAGVEERAPVERELHRPQHERERDRDGGEGEHLPGAAERPSEPRMTDDQWRTPPSTQ